MHIGKKEQNPLLSFSANPAGKLTISTLLDL